VFTARYGLIPYMKHVTFRLLKVNSAFKGLITGALILSVLQVFQSMKTMVVCA
jgi:hypothetical protein